MWFYWNSFPEAFTEVLQSSEPDSLKELIELSGCSQNEAEAIAKTLEDAIYHNRLREFSVIEGGVELHQPTEELLKEFRKLLEELNYSYEIVKAPKRRQIILWG